MIQFPRSYLSTVSCLNEVKNLTCTIGNANRHSIGNTIPLSWSRTIMAQHRQLKHTSYTKRTTSVSTIIPKQNFAVKSLSNTLATKSHQQSVSSPIGLGLGFSHHRSVMMISQQQAKQQTRSTMHTNTIQHGNNKSFIQNRPPILLKSNPSLFQFNPLMKNMGAVSYFSSKPPGVPKSSSKWGVGLTILSGASLLFGKTKYFIAALKLTKFASLGSMVFTIGTYSMFFGFPYAVGVVGLILVHETGHAMVMHALNIPFSPMVFIPFMGAVIATKKNPRDAWEDALVAFGGPVVGSLGALGVATAASVTNSQLLYALADFGYMVNMFNLLPIGSMDGGRIAGALSKWMNVGGLGIGGMLLYSGVTQNPLMYLIMLAGSYDTYQKFYGVDYMPRNFYKITPLQRGMIGCSYFGLILAILAGMQANEKYKKSPEQLIAEKQMEKSWDDSDEPFRM